MLTFLCDGLAPPAAGGLLCGLGEKVSRYLISCWERSSCFNRFFLPAQSSRGFIFPRSVLGCTFTNGPTLSWPQSLGAWGFQLSTSAMRQTTLPGGVDDLGVWILWSISVDVRDNADVNCYKTLIAIKSYCHYWNHERMLNLDSASSLAY